MPKRLRLCKKTVNNSKTIHAKWIPACLHYLPLHLLVTPEAVVLERLPPSAPSTQREPPLGGHRGQELWAPEPALPSRTSFIYQTRSGFITSFMATSGSFPSSPFFFFFNLSSKVISFQFSSTSFVVPPLCSLEIVSTALRASPTVTTCVRGGSAWLGPSSFFLFGHRA